MIPLDPPESNWPPRCDDCLRFLPWSQSDGDLCAKCLALYKSEPTNSPDGDFIAAQVSGTVVLNNPDHTFTDGTISGSIDSHNLITGTLHFTGQNPVPIEGYFFFIPGGNGIMGTLEITYRTGCTITSGS